MKLQNNTQLMSHILNVMHTFHKKIKKNLDRDNAVMPQGHQYEPASVIVKSSCSDRFSFNRHDHIYFILNLIL